MENKRITDLSQFVVGLMTCQNLLLQYLVKKGTINKTEMSNALDFLIDIFNERNPEQAITLAMSNIRESLDKDLPDFPPPTDNQRPQAKHPGWLKGVIQGGKKL